MSMDVDKMIRSWGEWEVLYSLGTTKVKKITINIGKEMSFHRHSHKTELWYIHQGLCNIITNYNNYPVSDKNKSYLVKPGEHFIVKENVWHQLINVGKEPLVIIELQYGNKCSEEDIERL